LELILGFHSGVDVADAVAEASDKTAAIDWNFMIVDRGAWRRWATDQFSTFLTM
jgi:hypothetical protein